MSGGNDKRIIERIRPDYPLIGQLPTGNVIIADISMIGARVDHQFPLAAGRRVRLDFTAEGEKVSILCDVTRCKLQKSSVSGKVVYSSGLRFCDLPESTELALRRVIAGFVTRAIAERKAARAAAVAAPQQAAG
jgi:hypothetical protein